MFIKYLILQTRSCLRGHSLISFFIFYIKSNLHPKSFIAYIIMFYLVHYNVNIPTHLFFDILYMPQRRDAVLLYYSMFISVSVYKLCMFTSTVFSLLPSSNALFYLIKMLYILYIYIHYVYIKYICIYTVYNFMC
jgi:hypothetical protein